MNHKVKSVTHTEHHVIVTKAEIIQWLSRSEGAAKHASVTIEVPRGGDCSGMTLDLDECGGLKVTWTDITEE